MFRPRVPTLGRDREIALVEERARAGHRLITLHGPPGVGKTHLARLLSSRERERGREVVFVGAPHGDPASAIARAANVKAREGILLERLARELDARGALLVIDEAEGFVDDVAAVVSALLDDTDRLEIRVTSQRPLGVEGELVVPLGTLDPASSRALFRSLAPASDALEEAALASAAGLPLAIVLAARGRGSAAPVQGDVLASAIARARERLTSQADVLLRAVASCVGGARRALLVELTSGPDAALAELSEAALVQIEGDRVEVLDAIAQRLRPFEPAIVEAHARALATLAARGDVQDGDRENLLSAFDHEARRGAPGAGPLAVALDPLLVRQGPPRLHLEVLQRALAVTGLAPSIRVSLLRALGRLHALRGRHRAARPVLEEAARSAIALGDRRQLGWVSAMRCFVLRPLGESDAALAVGREALEVAEEIRDRELEAMAAQSVGLVHLGEGRADEAEIWEARALAAAESVGAARLAAIALANGATALLSQNRLAEAEKLADAAQARFLALDDRFHAARVATLCGSIALRKGALGSARERLESALSTLDEVEDTEGAIEARLSLAELARLSGERFVATRRLAEAQLLARELDDVTLARRMMLLEAPPLVLSMSTDGKRVRFAGVELDLARKPALRGVLRALVEARRGRPGVACSVEELIALGWPAEKMSPESGAARVYMTIRRLRGLGLSSVLRTEGEGYLLDPEVTLEEC